MACFTWCGYQINWDAWSAIGTIFGAIATLVAVRVALLLPRHEHEIARTQIEVDRSHKARDAATMMLPICSLFAIKLNQAQGYIKGARPNEMGYLLLPPSCELMEIDRLAEFISWMDCLDSNARADLAKLIGWTRTWNAALQIKEGRGHSVGWSIHSPDSMPTLESLRSQLFEAAESLVKWAKLTEWGSEESPR